MAAVSTILLSLLLMLGGTTASHAEFLGPSSITPLVFTGTSTLERFSESASTAAASSSTTATATVTFDSVSSTSTVPTLISTAFTAASYITGNPTGGLTSEVNPIASLSPTGTSADANNSAPASASAGSTNNRSVLIVTLSAVLGSVLLLIILICLSICWRRSRRRAAEARRNDSVTDSEVHGWRSSLTSPASPELEKGLESVVVLEKEPRPDRAYGRVRSIARAPTTPPVLIDIARAPSSRASQRQTERGTTSPQGNLPRRPSSRVVTAPPLRDKSGRTSYVERPKPSYRDTRAERWAQTRTSDERPMSEEGIIEGPFDFDFGLPPVQTSP